MKTFFTFFFALAATAATAKSLEVTIPNVRSDKGMILVMAKTSPDAEPIYAMTSAKEGTVVITLPNINADTVEVSLFHDENDNRQLDMGDRGPKEGYATKKCKLTEEKSSVKANLYYPAQE